MMEDKVKYWRELSDYDLETAEAMLKSKRYLYVGFMCHQTIEKILKAYYTKVTAETAPRTHNLSLLAKKCDLYGLLSEQQMDFIDQLEPLNIEARYPTQKERLMKALNHEKCVELIANSRYLQLWTKEKL